MHIRSVHQCLASLILGRRYMFVCGVAAANVAEVLPRQSLGTPNA